MAFYNIIRSACCYTTPENMQEGAFLTDYSTLKSKQCALMLSNLDYSNTVTILATSTFKLSILMDCLLLVAKSTQLIIQKLLYALKQTAASFKNIEKDFWHPLRLAVTNVLFDLLNDFYSLE